MAARADVCIRSKGEGARDGGCGRPWLSIMPRHGRGSLVTTRGRVTDIQPATDRPRATRLPSGVAAVLSVLSSSAVVLDIADQVLMASQAARTFGLVKDGQLMVGELLALVRQVRRDGETREGEIDLSGSSFGGRRTSFAVRVAPLGRDGLILLLAEDQTESRRVEEVRRDFVANISHELKTPVGALALLAETMEEAADDPEAVRRFAGRMRQEASRLTYLVQDLITLSRIQAAEPVPDPIPVDLSAVVTEALDRVRMKASARGIELVAACEERVLVLGDEDLLVTALRNLLDNALSYSPDRTRVVVSASRDGTRTAQISVADQGIGIPERDLERIFERFYRVDPARSRATGGTGLGLAIVKHVMAAHRGKVTVWSQEGVGSTFTLQMPVVSKSPAPGNGSAGGSAQPVREAVK
jgi:two-component system, OmpR family, sensor histidine kinase SenX3